MGLSTVSAFKNIDSGLFIEIDEKKVKELQDILVQILLDIDSVCKKNQIEYSLAGGSALGLIRHKGFIPWDDDIDLLMSRKNYEKFCIAFKDAMLDKYWLHTPEETKNYGLCLSRVRKKGTICKSREDFQNDECGVYIDIFILENTFDIVFLRYIHGFISLGLGFILSCRNFWKNRKLYSYIGSNSRNSGIFKVKIFLGLLFSFLSVDTWTHLWNNWNSICRNENTKYVTVPAGRKHFFGELYERLYMDDVERLPFYYRNQVYYFPVMKGYDKYLSKLYGDYMKIPPKDKREKHIVLEYEIHKKLN